MQRMTAAEATVASLIAHGLDTVYALPGVHNDPLFDALFQAAETIRTVHTRHEQGAAYMALGAALATGKPQAYAVVPGPGLLNSGAALLMAYAMNAPVLALIGQIPDADIGRGFGHLHEIRDQAGIIARLVGHCARIRAPEEASALVAQAKRAMILCGGGAQDSAEEVAEISAMLQAPVLGYRRGRGVLDSRNPLSVTLPLGHELWGEADAVLAVGTRLHNPQTAWGLDDGLTIVRIDADPDEPARFRAPAVALIGSAKSILRRLIDALPAHNHGRRSRKAELQERQARMRKRLDKLGPQIAYLQAIRAELPEDGIFVDEVTQIGFAARLLLPVYQPRTFLSPGHQDNLCWGFATALGAQDARRDVPVVAISGDGGFLYSANELASAMHHRIPLVTIVFNDDAFGNVRRIQAERYGNRLIASDLTNPDFVRYAESFGARAERVRSPEALRGALRRGLAQRDRPRVIEVPVGEMPSPWEFIHMPRVRGQP